MGLLPTYVALVLTLAGNVERYQPRQFEKEIRPFIQEPDWGGLDLRNVTIQFVDIPVTPEEAKRLQECTQLPPVGAFVDYCYNNSDDLINPHLIIFNDWENYAHDGLSQLEKKCNGNYKPFPIKSFKADGTLEQDELDLIVANCSREYKIDLERTLRVVKKGRKRIDVYAKDPKRYHQNLLKLYKDLQRVK